MPVLIESSSETRRPRRSSFTQQLQRMFNVDKQDDAKKVHIYDNTSNANSVASTSYQSSHLSRPDVMDSDPRGRANHRQSDIGVNGTGSGHSSLRSFQEPEQPPRVMSTVTDKQHVGASPTWGYNIVQKKDRRATKRLEAERLELEKRMLKLEEAERTGDISVLRRESRRLTKKQPLGSSSRPSSVSGDESRPSSRLSSIFSTSRRRSRSRSSSLDGNENVHSSRLNVSGDASPSDNPNAAPSSTSLSTTLPERLGAAISKELAARKNALLSSAEHQTQPPKPSQSNTTAESPHAGSMQPTFQDGPGLKPPYVVDLAPDGVSRGERSGSETTPGVKVAPNQHADLDKARFAASLNFGNRIVASPQPGHLSKTMNQANYNEHSVTGVPEIRTLLGPDQSGMTTKARFAPMPQGSPTDNTLTRASTDGVVQRYQKKFKPSPLAESVTANSSDNDLLSVPRRAATLPNPQTSDLGKQPQASIYSENATRAELHTIGTSNISQPLNGNIAVRRTSTAAADHARSPVSESANSSSSLNRLSASKFSQTASSKPRFYNSLGKVDHSSGGQPDTKRASLHPSLQGWESPDVAPKSPKRNSRVISQYSESEPLSDHQSRPTSSLSVGRSPESESDAYDTADEAASDNPKTSGNGDNAVKCPKRGAAEHTHTVEEKGIVSSSSGDGVSVPAVSFGPRAEPRKQVKKIRQANRDQYVAKLFVICCRCKFWHDLPSEVYARLSNSDPLTAALDQELSAWEQNSLSCRLAAPKAGQRALSESSMKLPHTSDYQQRSLRTRIMTELTSGPVKCCWCDHHMNKQCCQGWTTVVHMQQRHH